MIARLIAAGVTERLGQPIVVENMPAAFGILAHQTAARAAPDGATFLFTTVSGLAINPVTIKALPYDAARDFTPVAMVVDFAPQMLSVNAELPVKSVARVHRLRQGQSEQAIVRTRHVRHRRRRFGAAACQASRPRHDRDTLSFSGPNGDRRRERPRPGDRQLARGIRRDDPGRQDPSARMDQQQTVLVSAPDTQPSPKPCPAWSSTPGSSSSHRLAPRPKSSTG